MQTNRVVSKNRPLPAFLAALGITGIVGVVVLILSANALLAPGLPLLDAPDQAQASDGANDAATGSQAQELLAQYQAREQQYADLVKQYQGREQQYQQQLQQVTQERDAAQVQSQQYAQVLAALQQAGIIEISPGGQISLGRPGERHEDHDHD